MTPQSVDEALSRIDTFDIGQFDHFILRLLLDSVITPD